MKVKVVNPKPGQSPAEALRTAPVHEVDQAMFLGCPKFIIDVIPKGTPGSHYNADGTCRCSDKVKAAAAKKKEREAERNTWRHG